MRIAVFGGSFDPVHTEHIRVAKAAIESLALDKLIVMPAHKPPHKPDKEMTSDEARLAMCRLAYGDSANIEVSDHEIKRGGKSYTFLTCRHLRELYKDAKIFFLVGTDMLRDFPTWKEPQDILKNVTLAVCARAEKADWLEKERAEFKQKFGCDFAVVDYNGEDVSSTKIRVLAGAGMRLTPLVDEKTEKYILEKGLYKIPFADKALALQSEKRRAHSLRVAYLAAKKAPALKIPESKAVQAALFHDCAKNLPLDSPLLKGFTPPENAPESVVHQFAGAYLAEKEFKIKDEDILNAICYHTSGREGMSALEKLIFLADMLEEERDFEGVDTLRTLFWQENKNIPPQNRLDECLKEALFQTLEFLKKKKAEIYPLTQKAYDFYQKKRSGGELIMENKQTTSKELALAVCKALADKRGKDIMTLYVREKTDLCDYFVLASGSNAPQIRAMGERVEELVEKELGLVPTRTEGVRDGRWAVVDYGDVIVHIFNDETRLFYHLERLWADGGNLEKFNDKTGELETLSDKKE